MHLMAEVSIILPVHNGEKYVRESLDSVLAQTFTDFELIVWDDSSTDNTRSVISGYKDARIRRYANQKNRGLFATLNSAIRQSGGKYVRLWSQDDVMKPHCLEVELQHFNFYPEAALAYCAYDVIDERGNLVRMRTDPPGVYLVSPEIASEIMFYHGDITGNIANMNLRRTFLQRIGPFREDMIISGDFEMLVRLAGTYPFCEIHERLIYVRDHSGQFSRRAGSYLQHIPENEAIYSTLMDRLTDCDAKELKRYHRNERHVQYIHHAFRSLLAGNAREAAKVIRQVNRTGHLGPAVFLWLLTANRHFFRPKRRYSPLLQKFAQQAIVQWEAGPGEHYSAVGVSPSAQHAS
jgi:glycosyltransferase involved in cell wall biosynthesis